MKRKEQSMLLAGLLALGLVACGTTGMNGSAGDMAGSTSDSGTTASATDTGIGGSSTQGGAYGSGSAGSTSGSMAGTTSGSATGAPAATTGVTAGAPNSTVTSIEIVQRQSGGAATGAGTVAGAAVGGANTTGTTGATMTGDRVYRITLRTDDGRTQTITQEWAPTFSTGDRVRMSNGAIQR